MQLKKFNWYIDNGKKNIYAHNEQPNNRKDYQKQGGGLKLFA